MAERAQLCSGFLVCHQTWWHILPAVIAIDDRGAAVLHSFSSVHLSGRETLFVVVLSERARDAELTGGAPTIRRLQCCANG